MGKPELLIPAGDLEKLRVAVAYGADAVYIGGLNFGLRAGAKNFSRAQMAEGLEHAHANGVKVYVTANIFARDAHLYDMAAYFKTLRELGADAVIVSDPGVFETARTAAPDLDIHISTQANVTNAAAARFWHRLGASRVIPARELSLAEIEGIIQSCPNGPEIETFVHGAMCVSYSGRCLLSAAMTGRSANLGACAQPCRWSYALAEAKRPGAYYPIEEDETGTYILNAKDLCMLPHIPQLVQTGIHSFKIEGRMKSPYYAACVTAAYRRAIDDYFNDPKLYARNIPLYMAEVGKASHRKFSAGFYFGEDSRDMQILETGAYIRGYNFIGIVKAYDETTQTAVVEQRNNFKRGDAIEVLQTSGHFFEQVVQEMMDADGFPIREAPHPQQIVRVKMNEPVRQYDILRKKSEGGQ